MIGRDSQAICTHHISIIPLTTMKEIDMESIGHILEMIEHPEGDWIKSNTMEPPTNHVMS